MIPSGFATKPGRIQTIEAFALRLREHGRAQTLVFGLTASAVLAVYAAVRAAVLNPVGYLDPWFYTATFTNFSYIFRTFHHGYWVTRLPWTIPGIVVNWLLPPLAAFFVLHIAFFVGGALFVFLLARRFFGARIALVASTTLLLLPLWFDAHSTDYVDGPTMTYLFAAAYFAVDPISTGRARRLRLAAAGFFAAAAFGTQIFSSVLIAGLVVVYLIVVTAGEAGRRRLVPDVSAASIGALALLLICGTVSRAYGGEFLFFMPSWRAGQGVVLSRWQRPGHAWMLDEPQLLIPVFIVLLLLVLLARAHLAGRSWDSSLRFAAASFAFLAYLTLLLDIWEFWFGGDFFEVYYYFSLFLVPIALALPACLYLLQRPSRDADLLLAWVAIAVAAVPVVLIYGLHSGLVERRAFYFVAAVMGVALACALAPARGRRGIATVSTAFVALTFATAYAGASGATTRSVFGVKSSTFGQRRDVLTAAIDLERFMAHNRLQSPTPPAFWYDAKDNPALDSVQSTYLWGITWMGREMPRLSQANRKLLEARRPTNIVLICVTSDCAGGPGVLARAGYKLRPKAAGIIGTGSARFYVRAFVIPKFLPHPILDFYRGGQSSFLSPPTTAPLMHVDFAHALPDGWTTTSPIHNVAGVPTLKTTNLRWNYEVKSPKIDLQPGSYRVYLRGRIVRGGVDIGILDTGRDTWLSQREYWFRQRGFDRSWMTTPFVLSVATKVQVILSNWVPTAESSRWRLQDMRLVRVG